MTPSIPEKKELFFQSHIFPHYIHFKHYDAAAGKNVFGEYKVSDTPTSGHLGEVWSYTGSSKGCREEIHLTVIAARDQLLSSLLRAVPNEGSDRQRFHTGFWGPY